MFKSGNHIKKDVPDCDLMKQLLMFNILWNLLQKLLLQWNVLRVALQLKRCHQILECERNLFIYPQTFLDKSHSPLCFWDFFLFYNFLFYNWINKQKKNHNFEMFASLKDVRLSSFTTKFEKIKRNPLVEHLFTVQWKQIVHNNLISCKLRFSKCDSLHLRFLMICT